MIEIKRLRTGEILHTVEADTLQGANLCGLDLNGADLNRADLRHAFLRGTNLTDALLSGAALHGAILIEANLHGAIVAGTTLYKASLVGANLNGASFLHASLAEADLTSANLTAANLINANLSDALLFQTVFAGVDFTDTQFHGATWGNTILSQCSALHKAMGLTESKHVAPSSLDAITLRNSAAILPDGFMLGVGYTPDEIENLRGMYSKCLVYYSCFLSHAGEDGDFAERLRTDLMRYNISCYHYRHDLRGGRFLDAQISDAIRLNDKLLLVCSCQTAEKPYVVKEIIKAMEREEEAGSQKLFPVRLDDFILSDAALQLADEKTAAGEWPQDWIRHVRRFYIPNFRAWQTDYPTYKIEFGKLLRDIQHPHQR